jgi:hypothetical protein
LFDSQHPCLDAIMPCGRCQHWIQGEWIRWRPCYATPFEEDWLEVHTSFVRQLDRPLIINVVRGEAGMYWYFFCTNCRRALRAHNFHMRHMRQIAHYTDFPLFQGSHSPTGRINRTETASQDSSETNPWEGHLEWSNTGQRPRLCQVLPIDIKWYCCDSLKVREKITILCVLFYFTLGGYRFLCSIGCSDLYMSCGSHLWIHRCSLNECAMLSAQSIHADY